VLTLSRKVDECEPLARGCCYRDALVVHNLGRAVQDDPMKLELKAPGTTISKLRYDRPLSNLLSNLTCAAAPGVLRGQVPGGAAA